MAETRVELNTGFETSQAGMSLVSKIALNTSTPAGLADDSGVLKRSVLEPDQFPQVGLDITNPFDPGDIDVSPKYPREGKRPFDGGKNRNNKTHDGKSLTSVKI